MKIIEQIPRMDDNKLSILFQNAQDILVKGNDTLAATAVVAAIEEEWAKRLQGFRTGDYKANTPPEGVLKAIGYRVGNSGISETKRQRLLDFAITGILPPVGSPAYMAEWGEPHSRMRYTKLHRVIRVLASSAKTLGNMEKAAGEWEEDLLYIEHKWSGTCKS